MPEPGWSLPPESRVVCIGAHCDDIEIGCGGTILRLLQQRPSSVAAVHWIVFSSDERRAHEAHESAEQFLAGARSRAIEIKRFRNSFFPFVGAEIKEYFEDLKRRLEPTVIFTHRRADAHQDHRLLAELTWNTFRRHLILEYEIPKYEGDLGSPNVFSLLDRETCERKVDIIMKSFGSQRDKRWFDPETFWALLRLRGVESGGAGRYAEGFDCRKLLLWG